MASPAAYPCYALLTPAFPGLVLNGATKTFTFNHVKSPRFPGVERLE